MDFESTVDIIIKDINELRDIVDDLKSYPGVPPLQVEIAKSKCRNTVEILELLKNAPMETSDKETYSPETTQKDSDEKSDTVASPAGKETIIEEKVATKEITEELIETFGKEEYFDIEIEEETDMPGLSPSKKMEQIVEERKKEKSPSVIYAERFSSNPNSVYDRLNGTQKTELSQGRKSSNLFEIIGLNDKFLFIREIFNGDSELYTSAITRLNNAVTFTDAREIILEYVDDEKDEAYKTLVELVKRKFTVNG